MHTIFTKYHLGCHERPKVSHNGVLRMRTALQELAWRESLKVFRVS